MLILANPATDALGAGGGACRARDRRTSTLGRRLAAPGVRSARRSPAVAESNLLRTRSTDARLAMNRTDVGRRSCRRQSPASFASRATGRPRAGRPGLLLVAPATKAGRFAMRSAMTPKVRRFVGMAARPEIAERRGSDGEELLAGLLTSMTSVPRPARAVSA